MKRHVLKDVMNYLYEEERPTCTAFYGIRGINIGYDHQNYYKKSLGYKTSKSALEGREKLLKKLSADKYYEHTVTMITVDVDE